MATARWTLARIGSFRDGWRGDSRSSGLALLIGGGALLIPVYHSTTIFDAFARPKTQVMWILAIGAIGVAVASAVRGRRPLVQIDIALLVALSALVSATVIAWVLSVDRQTSLVGERLQYQGLLSMVSYWIFFLGAWSAVTTPRRLRQLGGVLVMGAAVVAVVGLLDRAGLDPRPFPKIGRVFSTIGQPNALAAYLVLTIPITVALAWSTPSRIRRRFLIGVAAASIAVLVWTLSRGGYVGLATAGIVFLVLYRRRTGRWPVRESAVLVVAALGTVMLIPARNSPDRPEDRIVTADLGRRSDHISLWKVGIAITMDNPLTGTGPDTYAIVFPQYRDDVLDEGTAKYLSGFRPESPHNVYVATAAGAGVPALLALLLLVGVAGRRVAGNLAERSEASWLLTAGIAAAMAGHLVTDSFMTQETTGSWVFWVLTGAAVGTTGRLTRDDS